MKFKLDNHNTKQIPEELKSPTYYLNDINTHFICDFSKEIKNVSSFIGHSGEFKISNINFFIGANNSGKSRLLRGLLKLNAQSVFFYDNLFFKRDLIHQKLKINKNISSTLNNRSALIINFNKYYNNNYDKHLIEKEISSIIDENKKNKLNVILKEAQFSKKHKVSKNNYIPILRSLCKSDNFEDTSLDYTIKTLFFNRNDDLFNSIKVHTGFNLWSVIEQMAGSPEKRKLEKFCYFLSHHFFYSKKVDLIANNQNEKLISISINDGEYRDINQIGDGIQTLIILLFPIFMADDNEVFYIEEPEMNLHPAYQRIFIETLLNHQDLKAKNLKYFFTTHSNHFLDLTLMNDDVSFFQFQKIEEGKHLIKSKIKPDKEILESLGVNTSSVLLANTSIWVEGPTDRKYISKFLKLYCDKKQQPHLKEDIDFAFFEYGGNLIAHYLFDEEQNIDDNTIKEKINAFSSANRIYLLADNDNVQEGDTKYNRQKTLESISNTNKYFKYQNTVVKEIENLLPVKIISDFTSDLLTDKIGIEEAKNATFNKSDYDNVGLGEFYETLFSENNINKPWRKFKVDSNSGTLKTDYKTKLANFVLDSDYTYNDLIEDNENLKTIIENLYNFIKMTLETFKNKLQNNPKSIDFSETIAIIEATYNFTPSAFTNGTLKNEESQNQGSCKVFSFAVKQALSKEETLACFGQYYFKEVLEDPDGTGHQNIRNFMSTGFEGLYFEQTTLTEK